MTTTIPRPKPHPPALAQAVLTLTQICPNCGPHARFADRVRELTLDKSNPSIILGRASRNRGLIPNPNNLWLDSPIITKEHARFTLGHSAASPIILRDLNSTHGTHLGERAIETDYCLQDGDIIRFGAAVTSGARSFEPQVFLCEYKWRQIRAPPTPDASSPISETSKFVVPEVTDDSDASCSNPDLPRFRQSYNIHSGLDEDSVASSSNLEPPKFHRLSGSHPGVTIEPDGSSSDPITDLDPPTRRRSPGSPSGVVDSLRRSSTTRTLGIAESNLNTSDSLPAPALSDGAVKNPRLDEIIFTSDDDGLSNNDDDGDEDDDNEHGESDEDEEANITNITTTATSQPFLKSIKVPGFVVSTAIRQTKSTNKHSHNDCKSTSALNIRKPILDFEDTDNDSESSSVADASNISNASSPAAGQVTHGQQAETVSAVNSSSPAGMARKSDGNFLSLLLDNNNDDDDDNNGGVGGDKPLPPTFESGPPLANDQLAATRDRDDDLHEISSDMFDANVLASTHASSQAQDQSQRFVIPDAATSLNGGQAEGPHKSLASTVNNTTNTKEPLAVICIDSDHEGPATSRKITDAVCDGEEGLEAWNIPSKAVQTTQSSKTLPSGTASSTVASPASFECRLPSRSDAILMPENYTAAEIAEEPSLSHVSERPRGPQTVHHRAMTDVFEDVHVLEQQQNKVPYVDGPFVYNKEAQDPTADLRVPKRLSIAEIINQEPETGKWRLQSDTWKPDFPAFGSPITPRMDRAVPPHYNQAFNNQTSELPRKIWRETHRPMQSPSQSHLPTYRPWLGESEHSFSTAPAAQRALPPLDDSEYLPEAQPTRESFVRSETSFPFAQYDNQSNLAQSSFVSGILEMPNGDEPNDDLRQAPETKKDTLSTLSTLSTSEPEPTDVQVQNKDLNEASGVKRSRDTAELDTTAEGEEVLGSSENLRKRQKASASNHTIVARPSRSGLRRFTGKLVPFMVGAATTATAILGAAGMLISTMPEDIQRQARMEMGG